MTPVCRIRTLATLLALTALGSGRAPARETEGMSPRARTQVRVRFSADAGADTSAWFEGRPSGTLSGCSFVVIDSLVAVNGRLEVRPDVLPVERIALSYRNLAEVQTRFSSDEPWRNVDPQWLADQRRCPGA